MKEKTKVKSMYILDGGSFNYDIGMMQWGTDLGTLKRIIVPYFAFETEEGWVLFDTGWSPINAPILENMGLEPLISEDNLVVAQLQKIGLAPKDVTKIIISHLHVDHGGGIPSFPHAEIIVQKDEFAYARYPNAFQARIYNRKLFEIPDLKWNLLAGDMEIMPGMAVVLANGHTPGLQALVVELPESGYFILAADSIYLKDNIEQGHPPGNVWNTVMAEYSVKRLKTLAAILGGRLLPGHDMDFYNNELNLGQAYT